MASPSRTWAGAVLGCFAGALKDAASSEFGRVLPGFLFKEYLCSFLEVRVTAKVKRIKAMGEAPG